MVREQESSTEASPPTARYKARSAKTAAFSRKTMHRKEKKRRRSEKEATFSRKTELSNKKKGKRRRNSASSRKTDQHNSKAWDAAHMQCKREASIIIRAVASDLIANDIAKQVTMTRKRKKVIRTCEEK